MEVGTDLVADLLHSRVVDEARIGRSTRNDELGPVEHRKLEKLVVIDQARLLVEPVGHGLKVL